MKPKLISIPVSDQNHALSFYRDVLGFEVKNDIPLGGVNRWLTVVSPNDQNGIEILLEPGPAHFEPAKIYQNALFDAGLPWTQFDSDDVEKEFQLLKSKGVEFKTEPTDIGSAKLAVFNDTCGNYIQLVEEY